MADKFNVRGLDKFAEYFRDYADNYIIVGGMACLVAMGDVGLSFRATKDIDMIITVEELSHDFGERFWQFVNEGQYEIYKNKDGKSQFFRFENPTAEDFPYMIELFSRKQDIFSGDRQSTFIPIVVDDEISSLSAILLDENYYAFLKGGKEIINGISILKPTHLIAFKARAFIDLTERNEQGTHIDSKDLKKHKNDVFRLAQLLTGNENIDAPKAVKEDMSKFFDLINNEKIDMKALGVPVSQQEATEVIKRIFKI